MELRIVMEPVVTHRRSEVFSLLWGERAEKPMEQEENLNDLREETVGQEPLADMLPAVEVVVDIILVVVHSVAAVELERIMMRALG